MNADDLVGVIARQECRIIELTEQLAEANKIVRRHPFDDAPSPEDARIPPPPKGAPSGDFIGDSERGIGVITAIGITLALAGGLGVGFAVGMLAIRRADSQFANDMLKVAKDQREHIHHLRRLIDEQAVEMELLRTVNEAQWEQLEHPSRQQRRDGGEA